MHTKLRATSLSVCALLLFGAACENKQPPPEPDVIGIPASAAAPPSAFVVANASAPVSVRPTKPTPKKPAATPFASASGAAPPVPRADPSIPDIPRERSRPPKVNEWKAADERTSNAERCYTKIVREWLRVNCRGDIRGVVKMEGFGQKHMDYFASIRPRRAADFVVRLRKGYTMKLEIRRSGDKVLLTAEWPEDRDKPTRIALERGD